MLRRNLIYTAFGKDTFKIIEETPERLYEVKSITKKKLAQIIDCFEGSAAIRKLATFLCGHGVSIKKVAQIHKHFGENSLKIVYDEPFRLCEIKGVGFIVADSIARKTNSNLSSPLRIAAAIKYVLEEAEKMQGHLFLPFEELEKKSLELLSKDCRVEITPEQLKKAFTQYRVDFKCSGSNVYSTKTFELEAGAALNLCELIGKTRDTNTSNVCTWIANGEREFNITLSNTQRQAVERCFSDKVTVITGGPGTGKTTILKIILYVYNNLFYNKQIALVAPTGRAARRMAESSQMSAQTIHKALGIGFFKDNDDEIVKADEMFAYNDLVIIDESSMLDMFLASKLISCIGRNARVVFVGDINQLPSVGAGNVLSELIRSGEIPTTKLDTIYRQIEESCIVKNAAKIQDNDKNLAFGDDFEFIPAETSKEANEIIQKVYFSEVAAKGIEEVVLLSPFRIKTEVGVNVLNIELQALINPLKEQKGMLIGNTTFRVNDRIMQTKNTETACNGEVGTIIDIREEADDDGDQSVIIEIQFDGNETSEKYSKDDMSNVDLAYATTIHKSQGSEYRTVIIPILSEQYIMLRRNLIYTAITRAKEKVILIGQKKAIATAISKNDSIHRNTFLADRIHSCCQKKNVA